MRLALSNLALPPFVRDEDLKALVALGLNGLEAAPTRIAPWDQLTPGVCREFRSRMSDIGLDIPSLQAIFYGCEGAMLLGDEPSFRLMQDQVRAVAEIAAWMGAGTAVFGAPKQRQRGLLSEADAFALGAERLHGLARTGYDTSGLVLGLEPVPEYYGGDYLPRWRDVLAMVETVDHPGLRVHLDTGCVLLGGDDIAEAVGQCAGRLTHFQIAEPRLGDFSAPKADHDGAAAALKAADYAAWVSIEMLQQPAAVEAAAVAVSYAASRYGPFSS